MGTKIIIICGILALATILLGLFRLWWLRKCYDKARAEKKDVLGREQLAFADKLLKNYDEARATTWKYMGIALAVIAILGTAVWGFSRIAHAPKAEKKLVKVEKMEESSDKGFFYYFSYEGNLERFTERRKEVYDKILFSIQKTEDRLQIAKVVGDKSEEILQEALLKKLKDDLDKAKEKTESDLLNFNDEREKMILLYIFGSCFLILGSVFLILFSLGFGSYEIRFLIISLSLFINVFGGIASIFIEVLPWAVLIFWTVMFPNIFLVCKNWKKADWC